MTERHLLQDQMNFVQEYLFSRAIPMQLTQTRWGCEIEAEGVLFAFKKRTFDIHFLEVRTHGKGVGYAWQESLCGPFDDGNGENRAYCEEWLKKALCVVHYAWYVREITKAPNWIIFTATCQPDLTDPQDLRIRISAWVRLDILGQEPFYKFLTGDDYAVTNYSMHDNKSDRVNFRDFSQMTSALGSPVGSSYTVGHAPEAHGNFMKDGPWTFVPARCTIKTESQYVLPETEPEAWDIFVLVRTHDVKMIVPQKEQK